jgi:hypothetical protein
MQTDGDSEDVILLRLPPPYLQENARAVESESEGIFGGVGVGKNVPTSTTTSI